MPGPTVTVRSTRSISWILFISLTSTRMPPRSGTAPSERPGAAGARDDRDPQAVGELDHLGDLLRGAREDGDVGHVVGPAVDRERRGDARAEGARADVVEHALVVADDRAQLGDHAGVDRALEGDAHGCAPPTSIPADLRDELEEVHHVEVRLGAGLGQRALRPRAGADERVDPVVELLRLRHPPAADLLRELRLLDRQPAAAAGAVGPLRDAIDVVERDPRHRAQQLARRRVHALALVQPARVVVGDRALDRLRELDPALLAPGR